MATFHILAAGDTPGCHPLTITRNLAEFPLANVPLRRHQQAALVAAGLSEAAGPTADLQVNPLAWFASAELATFVADASYGTMTSSDGSVLLTRQGSSRDLRATQSFAIKFRGSTAIGDKCHVGQAVEIKNSILLPGTNVGHLSYLGDSILGEKVNFGAGTITSNLRHDGGAHRSPVAGLMIDTGRRKLGAIIGDGVHTGIHTSIYPGRKLWPKTVTLPGAIVAKDILS